MGESDRVGNWSHWWAALVEPHEWAALVKPRWWAALVEPRWCEPHEWAALVGRIGEPHEWAALMSPVRTGSIRIGVRIGWVHMYWRPHCLSASVSRRSRDAFDEYTGD